MKKILIVDDHPVVLMATKILLEKHHYHVVGEATNGVDALKMIKLHQPELVIIDIYLPLLDGLEVIERAKKSGYKSRFFVLTSQAKNQYLNRCVSVGASGFLSKEKSTDMLIFGVNTILSGYGFFPDTVNSTELNKENDISILSERELMVFKDLALGLSNKEISNKMFISTKTVSTYKSRIFEKLNISKLVDIYHLAKENKII